VRDAELPRDDDYYETTRALLERAYLEAGDLRGGLGFGGDEVRWERARRQIGEIMRNWGYTVAGEADGIDTNGVVFTHVAWTDLPETRYLSFDRL
jgi:hypothetical protein